jgi:hypothetical protein
MSLQSLQSRKGLETLLGHGFELGKGYYRRHSGPAMGDMVLWKVGVRRTSDRVWCVMR